MPKYSTRSVSTEPRIVISHEGRPLAFLPEADFQQAGAENLVYEAHAEYVRVCLLTGKSPATVRNWTWTVEQKKHD